MKLIIVACVLMIFIGNVIAQTGYTDTENFVLDTVDPSLSLISPIGGEIWFIGNSYEILWTAEDTNLSEYPISLCYRIDDSENYVLIVEGYENNESYSWEIPAEQSDDVILRVVASDCFGNSTERVTDNTLSIVYAPPVAPDGLQVDVSNGIDAIISWEPVTETINGVPITPDSYIILYSETPHEDHYLYNFLAYITEGTSFTHQDILIEHDKMFYSVLAYLNDGEPLSEVLSYFQHRYGQKISWYEIMQMFAKKGGNH